MHGLLLNNKKCDCVMQMSKVLKRVLTQPLILQKEKLLLGGGEVVVQGHVTNDKSCH